MHTSHLDGVAPLPYLGVLRAEGEDATAFLQGQLTNDVALLDAGQARLAGWCSAKGRLLASFIVLKRSPADVLLVCDRALLEATRKRLSLFVLRAKVRLSDASAEFTLRGVAGDALKTIAPTPGSAWACGLFDTDTQTLIHLYPACGQPRALLVGPADARAPNGPALTSEQWRWGEVRAGVARISPPIADAFVPQMLNYESVGGVSFKKGCYPGQEVVARSQYRGTLKRRAALVHSPAALAPGQEVFDVAAPDQPCGTIAQAAPAPQGGYDAIAVLQIASTGAALHANGAALELLALPYALHEDV